jgi:predicted acyl esterase
LLAAGTRDGIAWLRAHLLDDHRLVRQPPVRVFITGERGGWRELAGWPPPGMGERRLWLAARGSLVGARSAGRAAGTDRYRYDPADPTPSLRSSWRRGP